MAYTLNKAEVDFCRSYGHALVDAENAFIATLSEVASIPADAAAKVFDLYKKNKLIKFDRLNRRYTVKHGAFLDADVILRALASTKN